MCAQTGVCIDCALELCPGKMACYELCPGKMACVHPGGMLCAQTRVCIDGTTDLHLVLCS